MKEGGKHHDFKMTLSKISFRKGITRITTKSLDVEHNVLTAYCQSFSGDGVNWLWHNIMYHGGLLQLVHFNLAIASMYPVSS